MMNLELFYQISQKGLIYMYLCVIPGGQLGLWVGISAITVCELLDLIAQLMMCVCARGSTKVQDQHESQTQDKSISPE